MTDKEKLEAVRAEIHRLVDVRGYDREMANDLFTFMDSLPNEPVSEELEEEIDNYIKRNGYDGLDSKEEVKYIAEYFTKWQKLQDMGITNKAQDVVADVLSSADSPLDAYATEMAFMMLPATLKESYHQTNRDRICDAVRLGAKWQKEHLWKPADGEDLPEIDREVIVLVQEFPDDKDHLRVAFAHRPSRYTKVWNSDLGEKQIVEIERYDKGGWNIPNVKYWLDCSMPKVEED